MQRSNDWYEDDSLGWGDHEDKIHVSVTIPRTLKGDCCDYTYFQKVCSCGYCGPWRASKVTAQMDSCENKHFGR